LLHEKTKPKTFQIGKKKKTLNQAIQFEDRVTRGRGKHEGESPAEVCDRLCRTRVVSQRQLPTDHDYAVSTRDYRLDQSSPLPASAAADPVLVRKKRPAQLDRSLHITSVKSVFGNFASRQASKKAVVSTFRAVSS
jgi:hypothetical protein